MSFATRRLCALVILTVLVVCLIVASGLSALTLHRAPALSGWVLLALVVGLALYNVRKKFPFLPLGSSSTWLQIHIYAGLLSSVIFLMHIGWRVPNGIFETLLAFLFVLVFVSGVVGLWMSRSFAKRLTTRGGEVIFERIPRVRQRIRLQVERLVVECLTETDSTAIPEFYLVRLKSYFEGPTNFLAHLLQSDRNRKTLLDEIDSQRRYLNKTEGQVMDQIVNHVLAKDDLDYTFTHQATLKYWLFVHIPSMYALLVFAAMHVLLVHVFSGGIR